MAKKNKWASILAAHTSLQRARPGRVVSSFEVLDAFVGSRNPPTLAQCVWALQSIGAYDPLVEEQYLRSRPTFARAVTSRHARQARRGTASPAQGRFERRGWAVTDAPQSLPGVYAIFVGRELRYIGSARNVASRVKRHERIAEIGLPVTIKARYFEPESFGWLTAEARLIHRLQPPMNRQFRDVASWPR